MACPVPDDTAVARSLMRYEEAHGDPAPAIYTRFYAAHPDAEELFAGDALIPRRMMSSIFGILIDLADGTLSPGNSTSWVMDHIAYEVTRPMIETMFGVIVDEIRSGLGEQWSPAMESQWAEVIAQWADAALATYDADV
ncbi:globin [Gordonia crocea]|uniref:Globin n=1 Tax=Gordonia crocea TaxID=589162 RepID=A0A7I9UWI0_9ACTN|nr:globin [Gordonia crocea]GED97339.1 hypothetical protein nbrc107697_13780 [Gordonia crocea]